MGNPTTPTSVERIYSDSKLTFTEVIRSLIDNKIEEIVNNAKKVNTATSLYNQKEFDAS